MGHGRRIPAPMLRAPGNLDYLQFIQALKTMWASAAPDVPIVSLGNKLPIEYPSIVYHLELRKPSDDVGKPTYREEYEDKHGHIFWITAQTFLNVVNFEVFTDDDPETAEALIERFEAFIIEHGPLLERMGVPDVRYGRRNPDDNNHRRQEGVTTRSVSILVTTEKVISKPEERLETLEIEARVEWDPSRLFVLPRHGSTTDNLQPRYYQFGSANPVFQVAEGELEFLYIPLSNFRVDDVVYLGYLLDHEFIEDTKPMYVQITEMDNDPYLNETRYRVVPFDITLGAPSQSEPYSFPGPGKGQAFFVSPQAVTTRIRD